MVFANSLRKSRRQGVEGHVVVNRRQIVVV